MKIYYGWNEWLNMYLLPTVHFVSMHKYRKIAGIRFLFLKFEFEIYWRNV